MKVVFAKTEDIDRLANIIMDWAKMLGDSFSIDTLKSAMNQIILHGCLIYALDDNDAIVGMIGGQAEYHYWVDEKIATEKYFFVNPVSRKQGVGTMLVTAFEIWAKGSGCNAVHIIPDAFGSNNPAYVKDFLASGDYLVHGYVMRRTINV